MFQRIIDDIKTSTGNSVRMGALAAAAGFAGFVALCFLCAAGFIAVMQRYGVIEACLALAALFVVIAAVVAGVYVAKARRARQRALAAARAAAKAAANAPLIDPIMLTTGIQIARAVGLKKLIPLLAIAGVAAGYFVSRGGAAGAAAESDDEGASEPEAGEDA